MAWNKDNAVVAAIMASQFAKEIDLPLGNYWEPRIARKIEEDLRTADRTEVERNWRLRLGLGGTA